MFFVHEPYKFVLINILLTLLLIIGVLIYRFIFKKISNLLVLLILISIIVVISIFREGTYASGDLTIHTVFLQSFYESISEGNLLPTWAGGLCGGYGCPVFLFEYTMPFYIGSIFHTIGFSYLDSIKLFLATSFILSGITMYIFLKDSFDEKAAFVGSLLYLFAPPHLMAVHFWVAAGTVASFIFIPLAFLFAKRALEGKLLYIILGACNIVCLILSHSSVALIVIPGSFLYALIIKKKWSQTIYPLMIYILGAGLSSFYVLPALLEVKYTWYSQTIKSVTDFKPLVEYLYSPSYFGLLFSGKNGAGTDMVGYAQLVIVLLSIVSLFTKNYIKKYKKLLIFLLVFFFVCFLLMDSNTKVLWDNIILLRSFVSPRRLLIPIVFITAFLGAIILYKVKPKYLILFCTFTVFSTILNWGNRNMTPFNPGAYYGQWSLYSEYFEPDSKLYQSRYDSRLIKMGDLVLQRPKKNLEILNGQGEIEEISRTQIKHEYILWAETNLELSENTYYFPGWKVFVDGKNKKPTITNSKKFGTLTFTVPKGLHLIEAEFQDSQIRYLGKIISLSTVLILTLITLLYTLKIFHFNKLFSHKRK